MIDKETKSGISNRAMFSALVIWVGIIVLFFSPCIIFNKVLAPIDCFECVFRPFATKNIEETHNQFVTDGISQYIPYKYSIMESWKQDGYMGWNPYTHNGCAIPENTMASPGDPANFLYSILSFWDAWNWSIVLHFFIAGCGMILLLREYKIPMWGLLLAAISFSFYSQFILWIYHKWVGAMIWGPFLAWALLKFKHRIINIPAIVFMALCWRTGHLQACTFAFILVSSMWIASIWKENGKWPEWSEICKITLSYFLTGIIGALLSLDVFVDTLPRMGGCKEIPFSWGIGNILPCISLLFPNVLGLPQTLDIAKVFGQDLFDIKFGGGIVFILACIGCFNPRAPRFAKALFIISLLAACTPLVTYIYSRSTVVMALGMSWLAAWQLYDLTKVQINSIYWKRITYCILAVIACWLLFSVLLIIFKETITSVLQDIINNRSASSHRPGRVDWHCIRIDHFISRLLLWDWHNILYIGSTLFGVFCCYMIKPKTLSRNTPWIASIVLLTFAEILLFSSTWLYYSEPPQGKYIYNEPAWLNTLKEHVRDGSVRIIHTSSDIDFLCTNTLSVFGIRLAHGYETFQPEYLSPVNSKETITSDYAHAGISHILSDTKWNKSEYKGWNLVMSSDSFDLWANPDYKGRYFINGELPVKENWRTYNRISISIPKEAKSLTILESYHRGWNAFAGNKELQILPTERGGMYIVLPESSQEYEVTLEFRMPYSKWYYLIIGLTTLILCIIGIRQQTKNRNLTQTI